MERTLLCPEGSMMSSGDEYSFDADVGVALFRVYLRWALGSGVESRSSKGWATNPPNVENPGLDAAKQLVASASTHPSGAKGRIQLSSNKFIVV
jgi:hypothetical protein